MLSVYVPFVYVNWIHTCVYGVFTFVVHMCMQIDCRYKLCIHIYKLGVHMCICMYIGVLNLNTHVYFGIHACVYVIEIWVFLIDEEKILDEELLD
ncbi:hypothetical protein HanRHA438_Chr05g0217831 [Helianthus annuus]|nr:hypothetical protein HanRHA438_Chr05g0217831 [Helianthus annuus]